MSENPGKNFTTEFFLKKKFFSYFYDNKNKIAVQKFFPTLNKIDSQVQLNIKKLSIV